MNDRRRKLTDEQRIEAIKLYKEGSPLRVIAQKFGVSTSCVGYVVNPKSYDIRNRKLAEARRIKTEEAK